MILKYPCIPLKPRKKEKLIFLSRKRSIIRKRKESATRENKTSSPPTPTMIHSFFFPTPRRVEVMKPLKFERKSHQTPKVSDKLVQSLQATCTERKDGYEIENTSCTALGIKHKSAHELRANH